MFEYDCNNKNALNNKQNNCVITVKMLYLFDFCKNIFLFNHIRWGVNKYLRVINSSSNYIHCIFLFWSEPLGLN